MLAPTRLVVPVRQIHVLSLIVLFPDVQIFPSVPILLGPPLRLHFSTEFIIRVWISLLLLLPLSLGTPLGLAIVEAHVLQSRA